MAWIILFASIALILWALTIIALSGVNWIFISGPNTLPKKDRQAFKAMHDMPALNRFIGLRMFLPLAVMVTVFAPPFIFDWAWTGATWFGIIVTTAAFFVVGSVFGALITIIGGKFEKNLTDGETDENEAGKNDASGNAIFSEQTQESQ